MQEDEDSESERSLLVKPVITEPKKNYTKIFIQITLFAFNLIFFSSGLVFLGLGIWLIIQKREAITEIYGAINQMNDLNPENGMAFRDLGILLSVAGAIVLSISFLGCCGAVKEWKSLLIAYVVALLTILVIIFAAATYAGVNKRSMNDNIKFAMKESMKYYKEAEGVKEAWDNMMKNWACCGVNSSSAIDDFGLLTSMEEIPNKYLPASCCPPGMETENTCPEAHAYETGCYDPLKKWMKGKMSIVIGVGVSVGVSLVIGVVFALILYDMTS